jgi:DNA-binding MarR family transcriptional regulator
MDSFRLITLIRRLHHAIRAQILEEVHARGFEDITASHIYVFQTPGPDGARPTELARRTLMSKQSMNHLLAHLEESGYLRRVDLEGDGRARVLRLTPRGRRLTTALQEASADIERRWADALGAPQLEDLTAVLEELDALGPAATPEGGLTMTPASGPARSRRDAYERDQNGSVR